MEQYYMMTAFNSGDEMHIMDGSFPSYIKDHILDGIPLLEHANGIEVKVKNKDSNPTDYPTRAISLPIISNHLKELLASESRGHVEFLSLSLKNIKRAKESYWGLNILNNLKCFDWNSSKYVRYPESIVSLADRPREIIELKLKDSAIMGINIFRMYEAPAYIFVKAELKVAMEKANLTGIKFKSLDQYGQLP